MASKWFDEETAARYERFEFDFPRETLRGRVIALAGGSGGLGAATAALLASEGAELVIGYRSDEERALRLAKALEGSPGKIRLARGDLDSDQGRAALLDAAGDLYGLVVLAGDPARGADETTLRRSFEANFVGPTLLARAAAERMRANGVRGAIVLLSSMQGRYPFENSTAYAAAKAALEHAARVLAKESGGAADIRVNVVAPGATLAGMAQASVRSGKYDPFVEGGVAPRFGRAEDVARAVRFFLEPDNYVTGQVLTVDGGLTLRRDQLR